MKDIEAIENIAKTLNGMWIIEKSINPTLKRKRIDTKIYTTYHRKNMKQRQ